MKRSKNRRGLTQVKAIFGDINKQEISIYYGNKEIHVKKILFLNVLYVLRIEEVQKEASNVKVQFFRAGEVSGS